MYPATLLVNDNTHRAHPGLTDEYTETDLQGQEWIIPHHLWCPASALVLKDKSLQWVSKEEARRLEEVLKTTYDDAYDEWESGEHENLIDSAGVLEVVAREGYTKIGLAHASPDQGVLEKHFLVHNQQGAHAVVVPVLFVDGDGDVYLDHIDTSVGDVEDDCHILRLETDADIQLARSNGLLCDDDKGAHVQVKCWRSVIWQCSDEDDQLSEERLREFWRRHVRESL